jgi:hypothetical protein
VNRISTTPLYTTNALINALLLLSPYTGLVDDSIAYREANAPHLPNIDFVTEFPKPRNMKKGQPLGECRSTGCVVG